MHRLALILAATMLTTTAAQSAEYTMKLTETGLRDYYCTITVEMTNDSTETVADVNGVFFSYVDDEQVGRSKGASFRNMEPGGVAQATFETPNAPCDDVTSYRFVVGACLIGRSFMDKGECAARIVVEPPIAEATPPTS